MIARQEARDGNALTQRLPTPYLDLTVAVSPRIASRCLPVQELIESNPHDAAIAVYSDLWNALRQATHKVGGGFPGSSHMLPQDLAANIKGTGPFDGEGSASYAALIRFCQLAQRLQQGERIPTAVIKERTRSAVRVLEHITSWLSSAP